MAWRTFGFVFFRNWGFRSPSRSAQQQPDGKADQRKKGNTQGMMEGQKWGEERRKSDIAIGTRKTDGGAVKAPPERPKTSLNYNRFGQPGSKQGGALSAADEKMQVESAEVRVTLSSFFFSTEKPHS